MKKALVVFLILAVAGGLFAQTVTWSGGVNSGLTIILKDDMSVEANDGDGNYAKAALNAAVAEDNWGLNFGFGVNSGTGISMGDASGWMKFAEGLFKLTAGKVGAVPGMAFGRSWASVGAGLGLKVDIDPPIEGLTFGVSFGYPDLPDTRNAGKIGNFLQQTAFGVDYSGAVHVGTSIKLFSEEDSYTGSDGMDAKWVFGVGYDGVTNFSFVVDGVFEHLMKMADKGTEALTQQVGYKGIPKLSLTLGVTENFVNSFELSGLSAGVSASYDLAPVTLGAGAGLGFDKDFKNTSWDANAWAKYTLGGSWLQGKFTLADSDGPGEVEVLPKLIMSLGYSF